MKIDRCLIKLFILCLALMCCGSVLSQTTQDDQESSRQIVLDRFNTSRPEPPKTASAAVKPLYRRTGAARIVRRGARPPATEEIGVTIWRLRPAREADQGGRVLVLDGLKQ